MACTQPYAGWRWRRPVGPPEGEGRGLGSGQAGIVDGDDGGSGRHRSLAGGDATRRKEEGQASQGMKGARIVAGGAGGAAGLWRSDGWWRSRAAMAISVAWAGATMAVSRFALGGGARSRRGWAWRFVGRGLDKYDRNLLWQRHHRNPGARGHRHYSQAGAGRRREPEFRARSAGTRPMQMWTASTPRSSASSRTPAVAEAAGGSPRRRGQA